jgi:hypothetical protein
MLDAGHLMKVEMNVKLFVNVNKVHVIVLLPYKILNHYIYICSNCQKATEAKESVCNWPMSNVLENTTGHQNIKSVEKCHCKHLWGIMGL